MFEKISDFFLIFFINGHFAAATGVDRWKVLQEEQSGNKKRSKPIKF